MGYKYSAKKVIFESRLAKGYLLASTSKNEIVQLNLQTDGSIASHTLPVNVVFFIISGVGTIMIGTEEVVLQKGDVFEVDAFVDRAWKNIATEELQVLVIKENL